MTKIQSPAARTFVAVATASILSFSAAAAVGYVIPLLMLKVRFGFGDDDIPIGYGFDGLLFGAAALVLGLVATVLLSKRIYRKLSPAPAAPPTMKEPLS
jgi:hypothetical protein